MSHTEAVVVTYMSLALVSAMALSETRMLGGVWLHLGREVNNAERREDCSLLLVKLIFGAASYHQAK